MTVLTPAPDLQPAASLAKKRDRVVLRAKGMKKSFGGQTVLNGIELELRQGEVVLLRGENGSGKTTLLNILTGNLEPDSGTLDYLADGTPRSYSFPRRWWQELNPFDHFTPEFVAREGIGRTWQDVRLFGAQSLRDNIAVAEPGHPGENPLVALIAPGYANSREAELNQQADAMLARLGLAGREESSADMISLGQSKRVAIARAVAAGAKILFLDEPLAGLDRQGIADVLALLESLVRDHDLTLVIVEHVFNFSYLHHLISVDWSLSQGTITKDKYAKIPQIESVDNIPVVCHPDWFHSFANNAVVINEKLTGGAILTRIRNKVKFKENAKPVLEIRDLVVRRGERVVIGLDDHDDLVGFNLTLYEGEIAILQAPNGWGKSSLFCQICGFTPTTQGKVQLHGSSLNNLSTWERVKNGLSALPSDRHTFPSLFAEEATKMAGCESNTPDTQRISRRKCSTLSGGERQRVALSSVIRKLDSSSFFLLDEPFSALDRATSEIMANALLEHPCKGILILSPSATTQSLPAQ